jgi:hypothetical protein
MSGTRNRVLWLTPQAAVVHADDTELINSHYFQRTLEVFRVDVDGKEIFAFARYSEHLLEIGDIVLRLLAASVVQSVHLSNRTFNATSLAYLMEQCQSLKALTLENLVSLGDDHFCVLKDFSRPDLEIELKKCRISGALLGRNQGPTKLDSCFISFLGQPTNPVLVNGLRGNSRLKSFKSRIDGSTESGNRGFLEFAGALRENKGLVELDLYHEFKMSDETWDAVCDSLKTHPTLQVLSLQSIWLCGKEGLKSRIPALLRMLKMNTTIHTMNLHPSYSTQELFRGLVLPYLETNKLRPRIRAIQQTRPVAYRSKVLGRALLAVRPNANSLWMLLSGNPEVALPSTTATTAVAATCT